MTVAQLIEALDRLPKEAVVLMDNGAGLSLVSNLEFVAAHDHALPPEVILVPNMDE
jgi:hypothetical protein